MDLCLFKSAPHISPGALCAACDPMAIQPGSGLPPKGISFVHEALACQPGPFPSWKIPDYSQGVLKSMKKPIKHMDSSILLAPPQGTPVSENLHKMKSVGSRSEINLSMIRMWKRVATTSSSALRKDLLQNLAIGASFGAYGHRSKRLRGRAVAGDDHAIPV